MKYSKFKLKGQSIPLSNSQIKCCNDMQIFIWKQGGEVAITNFFMKYSKWKRAITVVMIWNFHMVRVFTLMTWNRPPIKMGERDAL